MLWRKEKRDCHPQHIINTPSVPVHTKHKIKFIVMHVVMNMLRGIPGTCVALGTSSVLVFCIL
jgi:hypothetical protein